MASQKGGKTLKQLVDNCRKSGYFEINVSKENVLNDIKSLSLGTRLQESIKKEWKNSIVGESKAICLNDIVADKSLFHLNGPQLQDRFITITKQLGRTIPFGVAEEFSSNLLPNTTSENVINILPDTCTYLSYSHFTSGKKAKEEFYKLQRQRKIWWMKISANPGRFMMSEPKTLDQREQLSIHSKFEFGNIEMEKIQWISPADNLKSETNTTDFIHIIQSTLCLETSSISTIFDAICTAYSTEICLNRKIAPYQCSIFSVVSDKSNSKDFQDLTRYIRLILQQAGISTVHENHLHFVNSTNGLDEMVNKADGIGIPYVLILDAESLQTGLLKLRNRDTTISETIHLSDLPKYLMNIFQIYS